MRIAHKLCVDAVVLQLRLQACPIMPAETRSGLQGGHLADGIETLRLQWLHGE